MERPTSWYPLYAPEFEADTAHLSCEEVGAYIRLLNHHFLRGSIPADNKRMSHILRETPQKTRKLWRVLNHFFAEKDGCFYQRRMEKEIAKAIEISKKRSEAGRKGGEASAKQMPKQLPTQQQQQQQKNITSKEGADAPEKEITVWDLGVAAGVSRSVIGKWIKSHGEEETGRVIAVLSTKKPAHPVQYGEAILQKRIQNEIPKDPNAAYQWAQANGKPLPKPGEEMWQWKQRIGAE